PNNLVGPNPVATLVSVTAGGVATGNVVSIFSSPNASAATSGNNAHVRVIVDGSQIPGAPTGFVLDTSNAILRGLSIDGFDVGVSVPQANDVGNLIQGNYVGRYLLYLVDPLTGVPLPTNNEAVAGLGNSSAGVT